MHCITYIIVAFFHNDFQDAILKDQNSEALRWVLDAESHQNPLFYHPEYIIASYFLMLKMDRFFQIKIRRAWIALPLCILVMHAFS